VNARVDTVHPLQNTIRLLPSAVTRALRAAKHEIRNVLEEAEIARDFPDARNVWLEIRRRNLTYSKHSNMVSLATLVRDIESRGLPGTFIEAGCARGGSSILMCALKNRRRPLALYDVFGEIPPPTDRDGEDLKRRYEVIAGGQAIGLGGQIHYSYERDLMAQVAQAFETLGYPPGEHAVTMTKGPVEKTLEVTGPVSLAHVDVDFYAAVTACLERVIPALTPGGAVVVRAYHDWSSSRKATDEYFAAHDRDGFTFDGSAGHMVIRKAA
jgi:asparagine synthase (glutamine-hydrolysing)